MLEMSSQDIENYLGSIPGDQEMSLLRTDLGFESQEIINEQIKYEQIGAENILMKQSMLSDFSPTGFNPSTQPFVGPYFFSVTPEKSRQDKIWLYSDILDTIFIQIDKVFMIKFAITEYLPGLFIRATPVYSSCEYSQVAVDRCPSHKDHDDPSHYAHAEKNNGSCLCYQYNLAGHVVRSHSMTARYHFDMSSKRHSVSVPVPIPQPGCDYVALPFSFACNTSCASGMQRRAIYIVFTLENELSQVFGRQKFGAKICACPKRDKERMERDFHESCREGDVPPMTETSGVLSVRQKKAEKRLKEFNDHPPSKKFMLTPLTLSSDTDNSDYDMENVRRDLESAMQMIKQVEPAIQLVMTLSEKIKKMYRRINRKMNDLGLH